MTNSTPSAHTDRQGTRRWYLKGKLHRVDGPAVEEAVEYPDGQKEWWLNGKRHRTDGPAMEYSDGSKKWYVNGQLHRTDGPAVERAYGRNEWWAHGKKHRIDGPAVEYAKGGKEWWLNGQRHRTDGPAVEGANGVKEWWVNGEAHRTDGPAIEFSDGIKWWYFNGQEISTPYTSMLTAAFARGLPIPPELLPDVLEAMSQTQSSQIDQLNTILHKYWPTDVKKILVTLFSNPDPTIKNMAFLLLGRETLPRNTSSTVRP